MQFPHTRGSGYHQITAVHGGMEAGWLRWNDGSPSARHAQGEITALGVAKDYQRHAVATRMYREARQISPVVHSRARTRAGERWARSVGGPILPLREEGYLADIAPPPVSPLGRDVREALEEGPGPAGDRTGRGNGICYLVLPIETVARMQSADFGVSMSEILPGGYITPGSFTNDGRYRVSELADDIRRHGVERPLKVYMGRTRPVVWDGQHRYAAATMADAAHLTLEITYPEDIRDVDRLGPDRAGTIGWRGPYPAVQCPGGRKLPARTGRRVEAGQQSPNILWPIRQRHCSPAAGPNPARH